MSLMRRCKASINLLCEVNQLNEQRKINVSKLSHTIAAQSLWMRNCLSNMNYTQLTSLTGHLQQLHIIAFRKANQM
jgi:hypothetical protein